MNFFVFTTVCIIEFKIAHPAVLKCVISANQVGYLHFEVYLLKKNGVILGFRFAQSSQCDFNFYFPVLSVKQNICLPRPQSVALRNLELKKKIINTKTL